MAEKLSINDIHVLDGIGVGIQFSNTLSEITASVNPRVVDAQEATELTVIQDSALKSELDPANEYKGSEYVNYGSDNLFPKNLEKIIKRNSKLRVGLSEKAKDLIGMGLETGYYNYTEQGRQFVCAHYPEFDKFYDKANVFRNYLVPTARSMKTYYVAFISVMLTKDRNRIASLKCIPAKKCRLGQPDASGKHTKCYVSAHWDDGLRILDGKNEKYKELDIIDSFYDSAEEFKKVVKNGKQVEYIYLLRFPTDEDHYPTPDWLSVVEQGWVDVSNDVPTFKKWVMKNLTTLNQILYINDAYFESVYPDWKKLIALCSSDRKDTAEGKTALQTIKERRQALIDSIQTKLSGIKDSGKLITAPLIREYVGNNSELKESIIIKKIDQHDFSEKYNADANEADTQILFSLGIDPSRYGNLTRTDSQGGTGKREAHNIAQANEYIFEQLLLEPLEFVRDFNSIPAEKDMKFRIRRAVTPTLDQITPSKRELTL